MRPGAAMTPNVVIAASHALREDREDDQNDDDSRHREHKICKPTDRAIESATEVAGSQPERDTNCKRNKKRLGDTNQRHLRPDEQPVKHIAAQGVRSQQMLPARPLANRDRSPAFSSATRGARTARRSRSP